MTAQAMSRALEPLSVLVVDDDGMLLRTLSDILRRRGYDPKVAASGREGIDVASHLHRPPAIALVDLRLPDMDGLDVIGRLRSLSEFTETVILTGHASVDSAVRALREHSYDYLVKPVAPDKLLTTIERAGERWQRRQAEEALRQSEERSRLLLETISDAVFVLEPDFVIRYASPASERILGDAPGALIGQHVRDRIHPDDGAELERFLQRKRQADDGSGSIEVRALTADARWRTLEISATNMLRRPEIAGFVLTVRDVTERRRLELDLAQAQKMESVGRLAGGVAHDFNNILSVIVGYSELLLSQGPLPPDVQAGLSEVLRAGEHAGRLTRQLLAFARRQPSEPRVLSLNTLVTDLSQMLTRLLGEDLRLAIDLDPDAGLVRVDRGQMEQVVVNLAVNARDAMPDGGVLTIRTRNEPEPAFSGMPEGAELVRLTVQDTGVGMSEAVRRQAFEPFFTTKGVSRGTGLGLAMCYGIVRKAGGQIAIDSAPGVGTTVDILMPRVEAPVDPPPAPEASDVVPRGVETILAVDDDPAVREFVAKALEAYGYRALEAQDRDEALRWLERRSDVRLVLTDVVLSGGSGVDLAAAVRARFPGIGILFMSGYEERAGSGAEPETKPLLQKPFSLASLARAVREVLDTVPGG